MIRGVAARIVALIGESMPEIVGGIIVAILLALAPILYSGASGLLNTAAPVQTPMTKPTMAPTAVSVTTGDIAIVAILYDGEGRAEGNEYVEIRNDDSEPVQLRGWTLADEERHVFTFPAYLVQPGESCRVYTNEAHPEWGALSFESGSAIWNNGGDVATLRDGQSAVIDRCYYAAGAGYATCD